MRNEEQFRRGMAHLRLALRRFRPTADHLTPAHCDLVMLAVKGQNPKARSIRRRASAAPSSTRALPSSTSATATRTCVYGVTHVPSGGSLSEGTVANRHRPAVRAFRWTLSTSVGDVCRTLLRCLPFASGSPLGDRTVVLSDADQDGSYVEARPIPAFANFKAFGG
jgi:hypothetical protein